MSDFITLDGYYTKDKQARDDLALLRSEMDSLETFDFALRQLYIAITNGDDDTGDGTSAHPYKTIERALQDVDRGHINIQLYLTEAGTYTVERPRFASFVWHMGATVPGVVVDFREGNNSGQTVFYNMHVNFGTNHPEIPGHEPYTIVCSNNSNALFQDSGYCLFKNITFTHPYIIHGGELTLDTCTGCCFQADRSNVDIRALTIKDSVPAGYTSALNFDHSSMVCFSSTGGVGLKLEGDLSADQYLMYIRYSRVYFGFNTVNTSDMTDAPQYTGRFLACDISSSSAFKTAILAVGDAVEEATTMAAAVRTWNTTEKNDITQ